MTIGQELIAAFRLIHPLLDEADILDACTGLFMKSTEYVCSHCSSSDVAAVGESIFKYIADPHALGVREITFDRPRAPYGRTIDYDDYARMFSMDLLSQNLSVNFFVLQEDDLRKSLMRFLTAILYRYAYCTASAMEVFPVSFTLLYNEALQHLLMLERRESERATALLITLSALASLELTWDDLSEFIARRF